MPFAINKKCTNCTLCEPECPTHSIFAGKGQFVINADTCEGCQICVKICPAEAIAIIPAPKVHYLDEDSEDESEDDAG